MRKYVIYSIFSTLTAFAMFVACTDDEVNAMLESGNAIDFELSCNEFSTGTRGSLYDRNDAVNDKGNGGGEMWINAYYNQTAQKYIDSYFEYDTNVDKWYLRSGYGWYDCYWPRNGKLNFFAYLPRVLASSAVTVGDYSYSSGPSFSCELPLTNVGEGVNQANVREFIYAFTKDKKSGTVPLRFVHPMSAIYFKLTQSHRDLTIHSIGFTNVYNKGTYRYSLETTEEQKDAFAAGFTYGLWNPDGTRENMTITVNKTIPEQLNFNAEIGGPFIIMPQAFGDDISLFVNYTWDAEVNVTKYIAMKNVHTSEDTGWQPGKKYTYSIDLGDNKEEILFRVVVEPWNAEDFKNVIDIE